MNEQGQFIGQQQVPTNAINLINQVTAIPAERKHLTLEQSNMAFWAAEQLRDHVDRLIVCDPGYNSLISGSENKNDNLDTLRLCRLLRLGELKEIWRPKQMGIRRLFYQQVKEYQRLVKTLSIHKRQLQASLRHWGLNIKLTDGDYRNPGRILDQVDRPLLAECGDPVHARLNTQRKILTTLWSIWKHKRTYDPEKFFSGGGDSTR